MRDDYRYDVEYGNGYTYDTYQGSGEVGNPLVTDMAVDLNENNDFTNNEIRDSLDFDSMVTEKAEDLNDFNVDVILNNFQEDRWSDLSLEGQKQAMTELADHVIADTGLQNPPEIIFSSDMPDGTYGGYSADTNTIEINQNMLDDSFEAADTIAHELWHAYQHEAANNPNNPRAAEYQEGFDNYISPEFDFEGYENQMVEAEARAYAQGYKDRIAAMKGAV